MAQNFSLIYYYIPQDLDDPENPNAYGITLAKENVTMKDIKKSFPLEGKYIFRFKYKVQNQVVWMDLNSDEAKVPLFNNRVFIKATRLEWKNEIKMGDLNTNSALKIDGQLNNQKGQSQSAQNLTLSDSSEKIVKQNKAHDNNLLEF